MTISNGYATLAEARAELGNYAVADTSDDSRLEVAVEAASRLIDHHCGQRFWQDGSVVAREFYPEDASCVRIIDDDAYASGISTTTGLVVKTDDDDDGTFETSWTITTDFILKPLNAGDQSPVRPYTEVVWISTGTKNGFPVLSSGRPGVQVTAKFGWPAVPTDVKRACLILAVQLFKAGDAAFGILQMGDGSGTRVSSISPIAAYLLEGYSRPRVA